MVSIRKIVTAVIVLGGPLAMMGYFLFQSEQKLVQGIDVDKFLLLQTDLAVTSKLDPWKSGPLAGRGSLVTQCANGDDAACDKIVSEPGAVSALQTIDLQNPFGFAATHPHKAASLARVAKPAAAAAGGGMLAEAERDLRQLSGEVETFMGIRTA